MNEVTIKVELDTALLLLWVLQTREDVYNDFHRLIDFNKGKHKTSEEK